MNKSIDDWVKTLEYVEFSTKEDAKKCADLIQQALDTNNKEWVERLQGLHDLEDLEGYALHEAIDRFIAHSKENL